jgi:hypothetical protein
VVMKRFLLLSSKTVGQSVQVVMGMVKLDVTIIKPHGGIIHFIMQTIIKYTKLQASIIAMVPGSHNMVG